MAIDYRLGGRSLAISFAPFLDLWTEQTPFLPNLHSGDVGWHLRLAEQDLVDVFRIWEHDGLPVAAGMTDGGALRLAVSPDWMGSGELAEAVAATLDETEYVDALAGTALRPHLLDLGWSVEPDPWVLLYTELTPAHAAHDDPGTRPLTGSADVEARTAVQRSAFSPGSTFHPDLWQNMTTGPSYDPRFEMLTWTTDGEPAAAATGWFAGSNRCAILEPVGTHQAHQRRGHGTCVNRGVMAALARAGASAVRVHTPASNAAAVAAYEACGLRQVDWTVALMPPG